MSSDKLSYEEAKARYICCPMCDRKICNRRADDCDVALYFKKENGGADMRKPNCVTCDHFGKCEGCEKGEEE